MHIHMSLYTSIDTQTRLGQSFTKRDRPRKGRGIEAAADPRDALPPGPELRLWRLGCSFGLSRLALVTSDLMMATVMVVGTIATDADAQNLSRLCILFVRILISIVMVVVLFYCSIARATIIVIIFAGVVAVTVMFFIVGITAVIVGMVITIAITTIFISG